MAEAKAARASGSDDRPVLEMDRLIAASPERVFNAFLDPETLARWWGPEGHGAAEVSLDQREGGRWRTVIISPDGTRYPVSGIYRVIDRPNRLVMSWAWENEDGSPGTDTEVELTFTAAGSGTHLKLAHRGLPTPEELASHRDGWSSSLNDLERLFA